MCCGGSISDLPHSSGLARGDGQLNHEGAKIAKENIMKYIAFILAIAVCRPCFADDMDQAVEDAKKTAVEAVKQVAMIDPAEFEVKIESDERGDLYYRCGQLILIMRKEGGSYTLIKDDLVYMRVVVGRDYSPQIVMNNNLDCVVALATKEDGALELVVLGHKSDYLQVFIVTKESVQPVDADTYVHHMAHVRASHAAFKSMAESILKDSGESAADTE